MVLVLPAVVVGRSEGRHEDHCQRNDQPDQTCVAGLGGVRLAAVRIIAVRIVAVRIVAVRIVAIRIVAIRIVAIRAIPVRIVGVGAVAVIAAAVIAAADKVVEIMTRPGLMENVQNMGQRLRDGLAAELGRHPNVGDIRGRGLFCGIELVADRGSKDVLDPKLKTHARIKREAMALGLMSYPMGGTIDGIRGDHILLAPPYIIQPDEVDLIVQRIAGAIRAVLG